MSTPSAAGRRRTRVTAVLGTAVLVAALTAAVGPVAAEGLAPAADRSAPPAASVPESLELLPAGGTSAPAAVDPPYPVLDTVPNRPLSDCSDTDGVPFASGLPALPCLPFVTGGTTRWADYGLLLTPVVVSLRKLGLSIDLGRTLSRVQNLNCVGGTTGTLTPCAENTQIPAVPALPPGSSASVIGVVGKVYVQSPLELSQSGVAPQFGVVSRQVVPLLAFGSIPARATVTVTQVGTENGSPEPLHISWGSLNGTFPAGTVIPGYWSRFGPRPEDGTPQLADDLTLTGPIRITVSGLTLDGVPVEVGTDCHTDTTLDLFARGGWLPPPGTAVPGEPGEYTPFNPPGYLHAALDIPPFQNCRSGSEVLDPLVTGLVTSQDNPVQLTQPLPLKYWGCLLDDTDSDCSLDHPPVVDPAAIKLS